MDIARNKNINFLFEASCGGGIPIIRALNQSLTADEIDEVTGILNGTTNYMLTKMDTEGSRFESVLKEAQEKGFKNYLYFIATDNPELNQKRVRDRVLQGGHDVPPDKIISRYFRCLENVRQTFPYLYRGFFFDSTESTRYLAEYHSVKQELILHVPDEELPDWFRKYILEEGR